MKETEIEGFLNKSQEIDDFMFSDKISNVTFSDISQMVQDVYNMMSPFKKRQEEHKTRDDLFKMTFERFGNYTKEVDKI